MRLVEEYQKSLINKKPINSCRISEKKLEKLINKNSTNLCRTCERKLKDLVPRPKEYDKKESIDYKQVLIRKIKNSSQNYYSHCSQL